MGIEQWLVNLGKWIGIPSDSDFLADRSDTRKQCLIASEFSYFGNVDSAIIKNLNRSGAFVETREKFHVGEEVRLKFPLHYLDPPVEILGEIAWIGSNGVGVKFYPFDCQECEPTTFAAAAMSRAGICNVGLKNCMGIIRSLTSRR